ncbi:hypothetical protein DSL92_07045 [Billgrantia gudaonensis]|uniref:Uncharacterized protein n=1 Tax=Billgrantia gudaonensis TaxID=376427 RepID=A0A3S0QFS5_9GAMM|nr:hypothetical protein DSL92_07045 [Halomonas gudaonensis]
MPNASPVKSQLLDIYMSMEVAHEHARAALPSATLAPGAASELHCEFKRLERDIADLVDDEKH